MAGINEPIKIPEDNSNPLANHDLSGYDIGNYGPPIPEESGRESRIEASPDSGKKRHGGSRKKAKTFLSADFPNPVWLSLSEASNIGGLSKKTIRRAVELKLIKYKIVKERYVIEFASLILFIHSKKKLKNKFNQSGIGQYIKDWKK